MGMEENPPKIMIRTPNWLGDLMMSTAFINAVLKKYPAAQVDLIVKSGLDVLPLPHRGKIFPFNKKTDDLGVFGKALQSENYDLFFVLPPSFSSAWMAWKSKAKERVGYKGGGRGWLLNRGRSYPQPHRTQHLIQEYLNLLESKFRLENYPPTLDIPPIWVEEQLAPLQERLPKNFYVLAPGALYGPAKQWPVQSYQKLCQLLTQEKKSVLVTGTPKDAYLGDQIIQGSEGAQNLCGLTSLNQLVALLAKAECLVSNDSGTMHITTALQRPQIAVFGSTSTIWTGPVNDKAQVFHRHLSCSPCFSRECRFGHYNCLREITPEEVFKKLL